MRDRLVSIPIALSAILLFASCQWVQTNCVVLARGLDMMDTLSEQERHLGRRRRRHKKHRKVMPSWIQELEDYRHEHGDDQSFFSSSTKSEHGDDGRDNDESAILILPFIDFSHDKSSSSEYGKGGKGKSKKKSKKDKSSKKKTKGKGKGDSGKQSKKDKHYQDNIFDRPKQPIIVQKPTRRPFQPSGRPPKQPSSRPPQPQPTNPPITNQPRTNRPTSGERPSIMPKPLPDPTSAPTIFPVNLPTRLPTRPPTTKAPMALATTRPTQVPTSTPSEAPVVAIVAVPIVPYYIAYIAPLADREPLDDEYVLISQLTTLYFEEVFAALYAGNTDFRFERVDSVIDSVQYQAGIPEPSYNLYIAFNSSIEFSAPVGELPTADDLFAVMQESIGTSYIVDYVWQAPETPFASAQEAVLNAIETSSAPNLRSTVNGSFQSFLTRYGFAIPGSKIPLTLFRYDDNKL